MSVDPIKLDINVPGDNGLLSQEASLGRETLIEHGLETPMINTGLSA